MGEVRVEQGRFVVQYIDELPGSLDYNKNYCITSISQYPVVHAGTVEKRTKEGDIHTELVVGTCNHSKDLDESAGRETSVFLPIPPEWNIWAVATSTGKNFVYVCLVRLDKLTEGTTWNVWNNREGAG